MHSASNSESKNINIWVILMCHPSLEQKKCFVSFFGANHVRVSCAKIKNRLFCVLTTKDSFVI